VADAFVQDLLTGTTERVSLNSNGVQSNGDCFFIRISGDGRFVGFSSTGTNLVPGDSNSTWDCFLRDRQLGTTERVNLSSEGLQANGSSGGAGMSGSPDGRYVVFDSQASSLVYGDTNGLSDVFLRDRIGGPGFTSLCDPGRGGVPACPCSNPPSGPGRGCDNSYSTGGAALSPVGGTFVSSDSLSFTTVGEKPIALSILLQGTSAVPSGMVYGQGVRCVAGSLKGLFTKTSSGGSITAPEFAALDPNMTSRSAAKGDVIQPGQSRWYLVYYRDPTVLGGCPATSTFNATQTGQITWSP
jgi:hypothetical protein